MRIKKLKKFKNIFSNLSVFDKFDCYTPLERSEMSWKISFVRLNEEHKCCSI